MSPLCKKRGEETGFLDPSAPSLSKMCQMRHRWTRLIASMWFKLGEVSTGMLWDAQCCRRGAGTGVQCRMDVWTFPSPSTSLISRKPCLVAGALGCIQKDPQRSLCASSWKPLCRRGRNSQCCREGWMQDFGPLLCTAASSIWVHRLRDNSSSP